MDPTARLLGKLEESQRETRARLDKIDRKIDQLIEFKWRMAGGLLVVSAVATLLMEALKRG